MVPVSVTVIEFTCLHCGHRLKVAGDKAGVRGECPGCGALLTIPEPIGGRLTGKRLRPVVDDEPLPSLSSIPPSRPDGPRRDINPTDVDPGNGAGVKLSWQVNALCGRDVLPLIEESAQEICDALTFHLESSPQYVDSAVLVLDVQRFDVNDQRLDAHARLVGWLNGAEYVQSESVWRDQRPTRGPWGLLFGGVLHAFFDVLFPKGRFRTLQNALVRQFTEGLDEAAGRPPGWWTRFRQLAGAEL